jgi:hypothetical protein
MARDVLIQKIRDTLVAGVESEQAVVYLLVETRKLADRDKYEDPVLRMFCNWVVHTDLANKGEGSTLLLAAVDKEIDDAVASNKSIDSLPIFRFETFKESLRQFLRHFKLPDELVQVEKKWRPFIMLYSSVVSECPIIYSASKVPLNYVERIEVRKAPMMTFYVNDLLVHRLRWRIFSKDGSKQDVSTFGNRVTVVWGRIKSAKSAEISIGRLRDSHDLPKRLTGLPRKNRR